MDKIAKMGMDIIAVARNIRDKMFQLTMDITSCIKIILNSSSKEGLHGL